MKYILLMIALLTVTIYADEQPAYLKDAQITVTLKSGKVYTFDANEYKVVPRVQDEEEQAVASTSGGHSSHDGVVSKPNRIRLMGGIGPTGLQAAQLGNTLRVSTNISAVGGLGYDFMFDESYSLNASAYTNGTFSLGLGVDF